MNRIRRYVRLGCFALLLDDRSVQKHDDRPPLLGSLRNHEERFWTLTSGWPRHRWSSAYLESPPPLNGVAQKSGVGHGPIFDSGRGNSRYDACDSGAVSAGSFGRVSQGFSKLLLVPSKTGTLKILFEVPLLLSGFPKGFLRFSYLQVSYGFS